MGSYKTNWYALKEAFAKAGTVAYTKVMRDDGPKGAFTWSRGSGLVEMASPEEAQNAIDTFNGMPLDGRDIVVELWDDSAPKNPPAAKGKGWGKSFGSKSWGKAESWGKAGGKGFGKSSKSKGKSKGDRHEDDPACKVHVGNLSYKTKWASLKDFMSQAGTVTYSKIMEDKGKGKGFWSRGSGLVIYSTPSEAQYAVATLNGEICDDRPVTVDAWESASV